MMKMYAIVTTDPHTDLRNRYDVQADNAEDAAMFAREQHGHEYGVDTNDVTSEYFGIVP
jgi:hypothetical protein